MPITNTAEKYLSAFENNEEFPGGLSYRQALHQCRLDYSRDSLKRIDMLLDQIREKQAPRFDAFLENHANQNFLYLLGFYVGKTIERHSDTVANWLSYEEMIADDPGVAGVWPKSFTTSIVCQLERNSRPTSQFLPLSPIVTRMFEGDKGKSVWFSATGYMSPDKPNAPAPIPTSVSTSIQYKDGQALASGDAVLFDGGLFPARVERTETDESGVHVLLIDGEEGFRKISARSAANDLVLVKRNCTDFRRECVRWLTNNAADNIPGSGMGSTAHAQFALGNLYMIGLGVEVDQPKAVELWMRSGARDYGPAQFQLATLFRKGLVVQADPARALEFYRRAARNRNAKALSTLGNLHELGELVRRDDAAAAKYYQQASDLGDAPAMCNLGQLLLDGRGVPKNTSQALAMITSAAELGLAYAQYRLGLLYSGESGVAQDYPKAVHWYSRAAEQGHAMSICNLADKYEHGLGVGQDLDKALELYRRAADGNVLAAWYSLGCMYQDGRGVKQDLKVAEKWFKDAATHNFLDSSAKLAAVRRLIAAASNGAR